MTRRLRTALAVLALLPAAGCGVQPTGPVPAGAGPLMKQFTADRSTLYFLRAGKLAPLQRSANGHPVTPESVLTALFEGPTAAEKAEGFSSLLPSAYVFPAVNTATHPVTVKLPVALPGDVPARLAQVVCTTIAALVATGRTAGAIDVFALGTTYRNEVCESG